MTIQEEAIELIERMPDNGVIVLINIMKSLSEMKAIGPREPEDTYVDEFSESSRKLREIAELQYDWNGNGAEAFSEKLLLKVFTLLMALEKQPEIFPTACDSIQLEYDNGGNHLEIEISEDDAAELFLINEDGIEQTQIIDGDARNINMIIRRFYEKQL